MASPIFSNHRKVNRRVHENADADGGLRIVLTPVQLSAVIHGGNINPHEIAMNRFWGEVMVLGGAIELAGGVGLLALPEPTTLTKIGGSILAAHGADTMIAGGRQIHSGEETKTLTQEGGEAVAYKLGADRKTAERTGITLEVAVPLVVSSVLVAARISAIRAGRIALMEEEAAGGHTILKHVGRTEAELRARLLAEPRIPAATSFSTLREAESVIGKAIRANEMQIRTWVASRRAGQNLRLLYTANKGSGANGTYIRWRS